MNVFGDTSHNRQKLKTTQISINWWLDKPNVMYTYNIILFGNKKEQNACYNMDEPQK